VIDLLANTGGYQRRILASGEMLELGETSAELHAEAGRYAAAKKIDWIIGVQGASAEFVRAAVNGGADAAQAEFFATSQEGAEFISAMAKRGDLILVKGSRGVRMERIVDALRAKYALRDSSAEVTSKAGRH
jgi:UDP-N-acetylmuramoyl-tripeptide--D-alanyl-D-alanine ligase